MLRKSIFCKYFLEKCCCAFGGSLAVGIIHINTVYSKLLTEISEFDEKYSKYEQLLHSQIALRPFKVVHQRPRKIAFQVHTINHRSCTNIKLFYILTYNSPCYPTLQELVDVVLVVVLPVHVIKVSNSIRYPILSDIDGKFCPILILDPVHNLPYSKWSYIEPR